MKFSRPFLSGPAGSGRAGRVTGMGALGARVLLFVCVLTSMGLSPSPASALVISEFLASNDNVLVDEDGEYNDWLELYNETAAPVDLGGWHLTDNDSQLTKWQFPSVNLGAGQYLLVWASAKNRSTVGQPLHTSFKLSSSGEYLALVDPDGVTIAHEYTPSFPEQHADISYGLSSDLISQRCFLAPTPAAANDESGPCAFVQDVQFSVERGYFDAPFSVTLTSATPGATIHYTTDGRDPSESLGTPYTAPISITTTTMLRAMAFSPGLEPAPSVTHTYIFLADIVEQDGAGLPAVFQNWPDADWEMDPEIVEHPDYSATIIDDMKTIPAMSMVADPDHWFHASTGIYNHPLGRGVEWERPMSAEFIYPDGSKTFQINCGVRIQGGSSRLGPYKKRSLRLRFKSEYGASTMKFPLFESSPVDRFNSLTLTARKSKTWLVGSDRAQYIRDTWAKDTQLDMGQLSGYSQHVHLYLNGLYWGLYRVTERPDASFLAAHLGGDESEYDARKSNKVVDGDNLAWETALDLAKAGLESQANYDALRQYVDVENLIDYMIMNMYAENSDWDWHNWYVGRKREPGAGFMFFSWDAENLIDKVNSNRTGISFKGNPSTIYSSLRKENAEFRVLFGDHVHRHFFNRGALTPAAVEARWMRRANEIDRAVVAESARWGDKSRKIPFTRDHEWLAEQLWARLTYFPIRSDIVLQQFRDANLYPIVVAPSFNQHGGLVPTTFQLEMTAPAGQIYYTLDGSDPRLTGGAIAPSAVLYSAPITLPGSGEVSARVLDAGQWSARNVADFAYDAPVRITELMYHPTNDDPLEFIELKNIGTSAFDVAGMELTDGVTFVFPPYVIPAGGHVLVVQDPVAFSAAYGAGLDVIGQYTGRLANGGERVRLETSDGGTVHDFDYDDAWEPLTDGLGHTLVIRAADGDLELWNRREGWRASTFLAGSPGADELPHCSDSVDNDGDALVDMADPGCASPAQDTEEPVCDDGLDNDGDGSVDTADSACVSASHDSEEPEPDDAFACYSIRRNREGPVLNAGEPLISNFVDAPARHDVKKQRMLCVPGAVNDTPIVDPSLYLEAYQAREIRDEPVHTPMIGLELQNAFGPVFVDTKKTETIMMPSAMSTATPVSPPVFVLHDLDHFKCYRVNPTKNAPQYFPSNTIVSVDDEFAPRKYKLRKPRRLCLSSDFGGQGIKNVEGHLLCYTAARSRFDAKHVPRVAVHLANDFGADLVGTRKIAEICMPTKIAP